MIMRSFLFACFLVLASCSQGTDPGNRDTTGRKDTMVVQEHFTAGELIPQVLLRSDPSQSFALYLPASYSSQKESPLIIAFDPQGNGALPLKHYKALAEKYGYILVGSNHSKNGLPWEQTEYIARALLTEVRARLPVNRQRIYLLGFSGGARIANALAIQDGSISGVICCGAAAPAKNAGRMREGYFWLGLGGNKDFNYTEMLRYDMVDLAGYRIKHYMLTFDGRHEWPPAEVMDEAFWWMELQQMRKDAAYRNDTLIAKRFAPLKEEFEMLKKNEESVALYFLTRKAINFYEHLTDLKEFYETWDQLKNDPGVDKALRDQESLWRKEDELRQFYIKAAQEKDLRWWKKDISELNQKIRSKKIPDEALMYQRVLGYLSVAFYMQSTGLLQDKNLEGAEFFLSLYVLVDPSNSEAHYLTAELNAMKGNKAGALKALNKAIDNGFADKERLNASPALTDLRSTRAFAEMMKKL